MNSQKQNELISALFTFLIGILFIILKSNVVSIAITVLGAALLVSAVFSLLNRRLAVCVIKAVIGVLIITCGWVFISAALYVMAAALLIYGILMLLATVKTNISGITVLSKVLLFLKPIIYIIVAICLMFKQSGTVDWIFVLCGIFLILEGVLTVAEQLRLKK